MAKITFVYPDFESLGVEYLMAVCLKDGHDVDLIYYHAQDNYTGGKERNVPFSNIAKKVAGTKPHIVAFSCVTDNYRLQLSCARAVKEVMPDAIMMFGGVHPMSVPEIVLKEKEIDCVAVGEAEISLSAFLKACRFDKKCVLPGHPVKGIIYKSRDGYIGNFEEGELPDLNLLPFPQKAFYSRFKAFSREYSIMTSRGCPYNCSYCFNSYIRDLHDKSIFRQRAVDNVIAEISYAKRHYGPKYITFLDDCFTANDAWLTEFCKLYKKEINLPYACLTIPQYLNEEKIKALSSSGCYHAQIGIQSLDKKLCDCILRRRCDNERAAKVICMLRDAGIVVQADHMLGIPGDTLEIEEEAMLFYNRFRPNIISVFWLAYYPKTKIIEIAASKGVLNADDIENINEGRPLTKESLHTGGSMKNPRPYYAVSFLLNYIPLLPRRLVRFLIGKKLYNKLSIKNSFISVTVPRFLLAVLNRKNFRDRGFIIRFIHKLFCRA